MQIWFCPVHGRIPAHELVVVNASGLSLVDRVRTTGHKCGQVARRSPCGAQAA